MTAQTDDAQTFDEEVAAAVTAVRDHPGVEHIWLNAFSCVRPSDDFAAQVGREVIRKVMDQRSRHVVLRINAS